MLEKKGIKKIGFSGPKKLNRSKLWPIGQPVEEPIDRLRSSGRGPVEEGQKPSLPGRGDSFTGRDSVEVTVTCHALNALTVSKPVDP